MTDGWYRIVFPREGCRVEFVRGNHSHSGSVSRLKMEVGCIYEPVHVLSERELQELLRYRVQEATTTAPVYGENSNESKRWLYP